METEPDAKTRYEPREIRVIIAFNPAGPANSEAGSRKEAGATLDPPLFVARVDDSPLKPALRWTGGTREAMLAWLDGTLRAMLPAEAGNPAPLPPDPRLTHPEMKPADAPGYSRSSDYALLIEPMDMEFVDLTLQETAPGPDQQPGYLEASGRLRVYAEAEAAESTGVPFRVEFILVNLDNDETRTAAIENGSIRPGELAREIRRQFPVPGKGRYRINAVVRKTPAGDVIASSQGPVLRVVE